MKTVEPQRFQNKKPEEIGFKASPMAENPSPTKGDSRPSERPSVRTDVPKPIIANESETQEATTNTYLIEVPQQRRKIRHPFDIYEYQLEALKKIQIAEREKDGVKEAPTLGDMAREALDDFIKAKAKRSANIHITYEQDKQKNK